MNGRPRIWHWVMMAAAVVLIGCGARITPPLTVSDPTVVYLVDYGRHTSLVLPSRLASSDEHDGYAEYAYGDRNFFALNDTRWSDGLAALLVPTQGVLGRRIFANLRDPLAVPARLECKNTMPLTVELQSAEELRRRLDASFGDHVEVEIINRRHELTLVPVEPRYGWWHNCNHEVAEWLRSLGCEVRGAAMTADFHIEERDAGS